MNEEYLQHHGILGMKWGIRRYQNPDGSYTAAGKKRYGIMDVKIDGPQQLPRPTIAKIDGYHQLPRPTIAKSIGVHNNNLRNAKGIADSAKTMTDELKKLEKATRSNNKNKEDLSKMSDEELRKKINRKILENQYDDLFNRQNISNGRENVQKVLDIAGPVLGTTSSALGIALAIQKLRKG